LIVSLKTVGDAFLESLLHAYVFAWCYSYIR